MQLYAILCHLYYSLDGSVFVRASQLGARSNRVWHVLLANWLAGSGCVPQLMHFVLSQIKANSVKLQWQVTPYEEEVIEQRALHQFKLN